MLMYQKTKFKQNSNNSSITTVGVMDYVQLMLDFMTESKHNQTTCEGDNVCNSYIMF